MRASAELPAKGYLYVILAATLWAVSGSSGKFLFRQGMSPMELVQLRLTMTTALLLGWLFLKDRTLLRIARRDIFYFMILGIAGMAMVQFLYFYSISKIHVAMAILLQYLAPTFIALHAVLVARERLKAKVVVALIGSTAGCYLVVGAYNFDILAISWTGIAAGVGSGVAYAWYTIHGERGMRRYDPSTVLFYAFLFAALFWNVALPPLQAFRNAHSPVEWGWISYSVVLGTVVPFGLYAHGVNLIRSTRACVTATLEPILAALVSYLFLGESLDLLQMTGGVLVIGSVIFLQVGREYDENTPVLIRARARDEESDR